MRDDRQAEAGLSEARQGMDVAVSARDSARSSADLARATFERYQRLLDEVRCDLARRTLGQRGASVNEVAFLLGFSDTSSFSRAFRRWTGRSPSDYRQGDTAGNQS